MPDTARWARINELFQAAVAMPTAERAPFLSVQCGPDVALRAEIESLLAAHREGDTGLRARALDVGSRVGDYEVTGFIAAGGMGEVYRARDTRLGREVAIKILPPAFKEDADRLARFAREARVLASLNHPHIGAIYGLEDADGVTALVMELVEGDDLSQRVAPGAIPIHDALMIARQIAEALEAAHEQGIIHRDLKPANIKVRRDGTVKVLDFGLAKALGPASEDPVTLTTIPTQAGVIVGTPAYMSPEQVRGEAADRQADIWSFGVVLYEMLTGASPFGRHTTADTLASVLGTQPDYSVLSPATPMAVRHLVRRCLEKDRKHRLQHIGDARIEIDEVQSAPHVDGLIPPSALRRRGRLAWISALALATLTAAAIAMWALRPVPTVPEARLEITTPPTRDESLAMSPDGLKIVFVATSAGESQLRLRSLDSPGARLLAGTERASRPFWSPDSRSIGFFADSKLKFTDIDGGSVRTLASVVAPNALGGAWSRDGTILFSRNPGNPIFRVPIQGDEPFPTTQFESPQSSHSSPEFLPDSWHFLFFVTGSPQARGVYIGQLDGLGTRRLFDADAPAVYAGTGHLLFTREGKLLAQPFDPERLETKGDPFPIVEHVAAGTTLSVSAGGPIAYRTPSGDSGQRQLMWIDRSGKEIDKVVYPDTASQGPALSHDGRHVAVFRFANGNMDIWSYETVRRAWDRITFDSGDDIFPLWSPDGSHMVFSARRGELNLYRKLLSAPPGSEDLLLSTPHPKFPMDWSRDGRFLLYDSLDQKRGSDIWALPLEGSRKPFGVVQTDFNERLAQFSPDGRWIAYQSDKTGRFEIYLRPFPGPGGDSRVSIDGGAQVRWNPNGRELFYIAADDRLMAVQIRFAAKGTTLEAGTPLGLFATTVGSTAINTNRQQYSVSPDGQSFVMNSLPEVANSSPITVILNWKPRP